MPIHPAPPEDIPGLVEGFRQTLHAVIDLGHECSEEDFALPTSCPGWSLKDHFSHIAAVEHYLDGGENPDVDVSGLAHVHHEFGAWMEQGVAARRDRPGEWVVAELETLLHNRVATLTDPELTLDSQVRAPRDGTMPLRVLLRLRLNDIWTHEQDIREVLDRIGDLDTPAAASFIDSLSRAFARQVEGIGLPDGHTVILESTGPVTARMGVRVGRDEDGELTRHRLFTGETESGGDVSTHGEDDPTTTITLSTQALARRAAGRIPTSETAYRVFGDEEIARQVLDALVITP